MLSPEIPSHGGLGYDLGSIFLTASHYLKINLQLFVASPISGMGTGKKKKTEVKISG